MARNRKVRYRMAWNGQDWLGMVWLGMARIGQAWFGTDRRGPASLKHYPKGLEWKIDRVVNALVLKTRGPKGPVGSNPTSSAIEAWSGMDGIGTARSCFFEALPEGLGAQWRGGERCGAASNGRAQRGMARIGTASKGEQWRG